jgi:hypothetical protein
MMGQASLQDFWRSAQRWLTLISAAMTSVQTELRGGQEIVTVGSLVDEESEEE